MKSESEKGFTLVEVIVVLVILAILAAILVPTMTGYIDKANEKVVVADARNIYTAMQAAVTEAYATSSDFKDSGVSFKYNFNGTTVICGRISNNMLYKVQNNQLSGVISLGDKLMAETILQYLDSSKKSTATYAFNNQTGPTSETVSVYEAAKKQPGVIAAYTPDGKVLFVEFGHNGYLCRIDSNGITVTKDGKFTGNKFSNNT